MNFTDLARAALVVASYALLMVWCSKGSPYYIIGQWGKNIPRIGWVIIGPIAIIISGLAVVLAAFFALLPILLVFERQIGAAVAIYVIFMFFSGLWACLKNEPIIKSIAFLPPALIMTLTILMVQGLIYCTPAWIWLLVR